MRKNEVLLGFLLATAIWSVILILASDPTGYGEICEYTQAGQKECTTHHIILVALWKTLKILNDAGVAITALATIAIAYFTRTLKRSTDNLWSEARQQRVDSKTASDQQFQTTQDSIKLARDEFLSTHRPRMRLKHAWFTDQTAWRLGAPLEINLDFVNIGSGTAYVTWINYQSILLPKGVRLPQRPPYDETPPSGLRITRFGKDGVVNIVNSGVTLPRQVCDGILDDNEVHEILWGKRTLYLIGTIEYWDAVGKHLRQTAFCRRLTYQKYPPDSDDMGRFCVVKDPDYEYED